MAEVPVLLVSGKEILAQSVSNSLGEFHLEYSPTKHLRLYVPVSQAGKRIEVPLNQLTPERPRNGKGATKGLRSSKKARKSR